MSEQNRVMAYMDAYRELDDPKLARFLRRVTILPNGCWQWSSTGDLGYGNFDSRPAHRWLYERLIGPISLGLELDHVCRNRGCVNVFSVKHIEPVTPKENVARSIGGAHQLNAAKTHCPHNHPYSPDNTHIDRRGHRRCRECYRKANREAQRARRKEAA